MSKGSSVFRLEHHSPQVIRLAREIIKDLALDEDDACHVLKAIEMAEWRLKPKPKLIHVKVINTREGTLYMNSQSFRVEDPWKFQAEVLELIEKYKVKEQEK